MAVLLGAALLPVYGVCGGLKEFNQIWKVRTIYSPSSSAGRAAIWVAETVSPNIFATHISFRNCTKTTVVSDSPFYHYGHFFSNVIPILDRETGKRDSFDPNIALTNRAQPLCFYGDVNRNSDYLHVREGQYRYLYGTIYVERRYVAKIHNTDNQFKLTSGLVFSNLSVGSIHNRAYSALQLLAHNYGLIRSGLGQFLGGSDEFISLSGTVLHLIQLPPHNFELSVVNDKSEDSDDREYSVHSQRENFKPSELSSQFSGGAFVFFGIVFRICGNFAWGLSGLGWNWRRRVPIGCVCWLLAVFFVVHGAKLITEQTSVFAPLPSDSRLVVMSLSPPGPSRLAQASELPGVSSQCL
jgi:hypothetical protein